MTDYWWQLASGGRVPDGAVPHGYDDNGEPLWVCRVRMHGGMHPGKVRPGLGMAAVASGGEELSAPGEYEVLMDRGVWGIAFGGQVPDDAYPAGHEHNGDPLYVARAAVHGNNLQLGKVRRDFGAAHIGYGNREVMLHAYEVLLRPDVPVLASPDDSPTVTREPAPMVPPTYTPMRQAVRADVSPAVVDGNQVTVTITVGLGPR